MLGYYRGWWIGELWTPALPIARDYITSKHETKRRRCKHRKWIVRRIVNQPGITNTYIMKTCLTLLKHPTWNNMATSTKLWPIVATLSQQIGNSEHSSRQCWIHFCAWFGGYELSSATKAFTSPTIWLSELSGDVRRAFATTCSAFANRFFQRYLCDSQRTDGMFSSWKYSGLGMG